MSNQYKKVTEYLSKEFQYNPYTKQIEEVGISQEVIDGVKADIIQNETDIQLTVTSLDSKANKATILSEINLSSEWVQIAWDKINITGNTTFNALSTDVGNKIDLWNAASDINANTTTIDGWKITANTLVLESSNLAVGVNPTTWIILDSSWFRAYNSWVNTLNFNAIDGSLLLAWNISSTATITWGAIVGWSFATEDTWIRRIHMYDDNIVWLNWDNVELLRAQAKTYTVELEFKAVKPDSTSIWGSIEGIYNTDISEFEFDFSRNIQLSHYDLHLDTWKIMWHQWNDSTYGWELRFITERLRFENNSHRTYLWEELIDRDDDGSIKWDSSVNKWEVTDWAWTHYI